MVKRYNNNMIYYNIIYPHYIIYTEFLQKDALFKNAKTHFNLNKKQRKDIIGFRRTSGLSMKYYIIYVITPGVLAHCNTVKIVDDDCSTIMSGEILDDLPNFFHRNRNCVKFPLVDLRLDKPL